MLRNPLIAPILLILKESPQAIKEYDLIQQLEKNGIEFESVNISSEVALFKKHFLVMNALYCLQQELLEEDLFLVIDPLNIQLHICSRDNEALAMSVEAEAKLRDYYLDFNHYANTTDKDVSDLLNGFWKKYYSLDKKVLAFKTLELKSDVSLDCVKQSYRRLASQYHPDKGGCPKRFIEIREAYEILKCCF